MTMDFGTCFISLSGDAFNMGAVGHITLEAEGHVSFLLHHLHGVIVGGFIDVDAHNYCPKPSHLDDKSKRKQKVTLMIYILRD